MKINFKKIMAMLLAMLMIASVFNVTVFAAEFTITYMPGQAAVESDVYIDTFTTTITLRSETYTREHYTQTGWATEEGGGLKYRFGARYRTKKNVVLYPVWEGEECTITYSPGQYGEGVETTETTNYGKTAILSDAIFTREGYAQTGWALIDGGKLHYSLGERFTVVEDTTLYPYWVENQCGSNLTHTWENGVCSVCGKTCGTDVEHSWENGVCTVCNKICGTDVEHSWENGVCFICGAVCGTDTKHTFEDRVCENCGIVCGADMEHIWEKGICSACGFTCGHTFENGICSVCGDYEPAILVTADNYKALNLDESYICYYAIGNVGQLHWFRDFVNSNKQLSGADTEDDVTDDVYSTAANAVLINDIDMNPEYIFDLESAMNGGPSIYDKNGNELPDGSIDLLYWKEGIGSSSSVAYAGVFDGNAFSIKDLYSLHTGLFNCNYGTIKNLKIEFGESVAPLNDVGAICSENNGEIFNCSNYAIAISADGVSGNICGYNSGTISECVNYVLIGFYGGICGQNDGKILNCSNYGDSVSSEAMVAGICYQNNNGVISGCTNYGNMYLGVGICCINYGKIIDNCNVADFIDVQGASGICAYNGGNIENCYNIGNMKATSTASGICAETVAGTIKNCYNTGKLICTGSNVGAICASSTDTTIENCYYLKDCATDGDGVVQNGIGNETLGMATEDVDGSTTAKTSEQFASGEVCYLLNNGVTDGKQAFYQNIDNGEEVDSSPAFSGGTVYKVGPCIGTKEYTNIEADAVCEHKWENGICSNCELVCEHTWEKGVCTICGIVCGVNVDHIWENGICNICDAVCGTDVEHTWKDGVCSVCSATCEHGSYDFNGFCAECGFAYEPAILVTAENYKILNLTDKYIGYYAIKNAGQLYWFGEVINSDEQCNEYDIVYNEEYDIYTRSANAVLLNDIDINPGYTFNSDGTATYNGKKVTEGYREWIPIGSFDEEVYYSGEFDGNGCCINGVYIKSTNRNVALFAINYGTIKSLGVKDSYIWSDYSAGAICVSNVGTITDCYSSESYIYGTTIAGGISIGNSGTINDCYSLSYLYAMGCIGGICGSNVGTVSNCYFDGGFFQYLTSYTGGICGYNDGNISQCYNLANLVGTAYVGGICGVNGYYGITADCFNLGKIQGNFEEEQSCGIAGICGYGEGGTIKSCYNVGTIGEIGRCVGAICGQTKEAIIENCYYLEGCATDGDGVVQNGIGNETLGAVTEDVDGATIAKTAEQFASGEVCYLLNNGATDGKQAFYQNIDNGEEVDSSPAFSGGTVYKVGPCTGIKAYTNIEVDAVCEHIWGNDVCSTCGLSMLKSVSDKTKIDHTGKSVFTELLLCKTLDEIVTVIEGYTTKLTASFGDYIGTGSTVEVLDSDANTVSTYTIVVKNDVNGDSVCDVLDCAQISRVANGHETLDGAYKLAADSDNNGEIDANDYQAIVNAVLQ